MRLIDDRILQDLEKSLGLDFLQEEEKIKFTKELVALISNRAGLRIMKEFSEAETREFNKIPEENLEEMENYIITKNPEAKKIFEEEAEKVKEEILNSKI